MKNLLILGALLITSCYSEETTAPKEVSQVGIGVEVEAGDDEYDDDGDQIIWIGPGLYYGIWFDNEWEYNDWHDHHYHGHHHDHHRHDHHHDGHHHDGGHHGGGGHHDGGHHGGGGHGGHHH